jgi:hypothetical protein
VKAERHNMRAKICGVVLGSAISILSAQAAETNLAMQEVTTLRLSVDLVDGSRLIGIPGITNVPVQTSYAKMDVPLTQIRSLKIGDDHETVTLILLNGDKLTGVISLKPIDLKTVFGTVSVGIEHIKEIGVVLSGGALPESLKKGLVLCYSFDRDEDGKVTDFSGKENHGKTHGTTWTPEGKVGGACRFPGTDNYIDLGNRNFKGNPAITLAAWIRPEPGYNTIFGKFCGSATREYKVYHSNQGVAFAANYDDRTEAPVNSVPLNQWTHVVVVASEGCASIYLNGKLTSTGRYGYPMTEGANNLYIGHEEDVGGVREFHGTIDEVMIYNRALSEDEVKLLNDAQK